MASVNPGKAVSRAFTVPAGVQHKLEAINPGQAFKAAVAPVVKAFDRATTIPGISVPSPVTDSISVGGSAVVADEARRGAALRAAEGSDARQRFLAGAGGGATGLAIGPLGRTGRGSTGHSSLLGR